ncbi:hypothetical protein Tco_0413996 [Tanacetum coccineum]
MEPNIENMTLNEYLKYEAEKERRLRRNVFGDLFKMEAENLIEMKQEEAKVEDVHTLLEPDPVVQSCVPLLPSPDEVKVPDVMDGVIQPSIPQVIHTTPPDKDYVTPDTKSILDELLEEFRDEILNVTMVDEEANFNPTRDIEELERLIATDNESSFIEIQVLTAMGWKSESPWLVVKRIIIVADCNYGVVGYPSYAVVRLRLVAYAKCNRDSYKIFLAAIQVDARGVVLGCLLAARKPFKPD